MYHFGSDRKQRSRRERALTRKCAIFYSLPTVRVRGISLTDWSPLLKVAVPADALMKIYSFAKGLPCLRAGPEVLPHRWTERRVHLDLVAVLKLGRIAPEVCWISIQPCYMLYCPPRLFKARNGPLLRSYWIRIRFAEYRLPRITLLGSSVNRGV